MGVDLDLPVTVTVGADMTDTFEVTLKLDATMLANDFGTLEESHGFVELTNQMDAGETLRVPFYVVPRPWTQLDVSADIASAPSLTSTIYLTHSGPISSSLWAYPAVVFDPEDPAVGDEGDLRLVGMDYGWLSGSYGDIFVPAINTWGSWHTPQPYFAEFDMYMDVNEDGAFDLVNFNFNLGWWNGQDDNDIWIVVQIDFGLGQLFLGSPYTIYTDYNAGFMEWYLPSAWNGLDQVGSGGNTDFGFVLNGFDISYFGPPNADSSGGASFDVARPPLALMWSDDPGPSNDNAMVMFKVFGGGSQGVMVVDYAGAPGAGQAYFVPHPYNYMLFMPVGFRD
jgi:hypothetical protein